MVAGKKRWTLKRRSALTQWIAEAKDTMALNDWNVHLDWVGTLATHPPEEDDITAFATITHYPSSKHAIMAVSNELLLETPEVQTQVLVHELVHCHLFALHEFTRGTFELAVQENELANKLHQHQLTQYVESATDALADAFAPLVTLVDLV